MTTNKKITIRAPENDQEIQDFLKVVSQALFFPGVDLDVWVQREGIENISVASLDDQIAGGLIIQPMGLWIGGRNVSMDAVRVVGVSPEYRASGVGSALMQEAVKEMHRKGTALSMLYPATQPVYRRVGFEMAGARIQYQVDTKAIDVRERSLRVRPIEQSDHALMKELYTSRAKQTSGNLDRNNWYWHRILEPMSSQPPIHGYLFYNGDTPEGYVVFTQNAGCTFHENAIVVTDLVLVSANANRRFLSFMAEHRSMAHSFSWHGSPVDPVHFMLAEQHLKITDRIDWMVRVVNVRGALETRGYPISINGELHLDVTDSLLPENQGKWVLNVADGVGKVTKGGRGDLSVDINGLAPLYTSHLSAHALQMAGLLSSDDPTLALATSLFAGPAPWMPDMF